VGVLRCHADHLASDVFDASGDNDNDGGIHGTADVDFLETDGQMSATAYQ
jgi:hypothetical protein